MSSVSERLARYRAAAEETSKFGDLDAAPPAREWDTPQTAPIATTSSIASKAQEYEKSVEILRADQDTPGLIEKFQKSDVVKQDAESSLRTRNVSQTSPITATAATSIATKAQEYEKNVQILRADQDSPGFIEKIQKGESIVEVAEETAIDKVPPSPPAPPPAAARKKATRITTPKQTNAILQRTKQYEKSIRLLRADQEKPGIAEKLLLRNQSYNSDIANTIMLEPSIAAPGSNKTLTESQTNSDSVSESSESDNVIVESDNDEETVEEEEEDSFNEIKVTERIIQENDSHLSNKPPIVMDGEGDDGDNQQSTTIHPPAPRFSDIALPSQYTLQKLGSTDPRRSRGSSKTGSITRKLGEKQKSHKTLNSSFHSGTIFSGDEFDAISTESIERGANSKSNSEEEEEDEGAVEMEELIGGSEFTNDAVLVEEEESISVRKYYEAKERQNTQQQVKLEKLPSLASLPASKSISSSSSSSNTNSNNSSRTLTTSNSSFEDFGIIRLPERGSDRPAPPVKRVEQIRRPVRRVPRADTGRPESVANSASLPTPDSMLDEASEAEDEGVRLGWSRQHSDRLPKAKVVMIPRRRSADGGAGTFTGSGGGSTIQLTDSTSSNNDDDLTGPSTLPNRRLVKQYKDRAEFMGGRVSRVDQNRASRLALEREERAKRHAQNVARRSSLVAHTVDRISMAADPFIEFMDKGGTKGPRKPRGTLGKLWYKLFKRKNKRGKDLIKSG